MTLIISHQAQIHIRAIKAYSVEHWGKAKAQQYINELRFTMKGLSINPRKGLDSSDARAGTLRFPCNSHMIYYRPQHDGIVVTAVLHKSQLPTKHLS